MRYTLKPRNLDCTAGYSFNGKPINRMNRTECRRLAKALMLENTELKERMRIEQDLTKERLFGNATVLKEVNWNKLSKELLYGSRD